jgi:transposase
MDVMHARCAGLDVHKETVVACVRLVIDGHVQREVRTFGTTTKDLLALGDWLRERQCTHAAMESTGVYWKPVWHVLEDSLTLVLANAMHIRNVPGRKTDVNDATWIADLLAHGLIRGSFVPPTAVQEMRDLTRTRKQLVREAAQHCQRLQNAYSGRTWARVPTAPGHGFRRHLGTDSGALGHPFRCTWAPIPAHLGKGTARG